MLIIPCISAAAAETMILEDGTGTGLIIVRRSLLRQICRQIDEAALGSSGEHFGLLLGPEPQGDDLLVEDIIPLGGESHFARSPEMLFTGIDSVQPMLEEARQERFHRIVGFYRILRSSEGTFSENLLEFLSINREKRSSGCDVRCCFEFVCLPASKILLRVQMRNGEYWKQIQELTLQWEPPASDLTLKDPASTPNLSEVPNAAGNAGPILGNIHGRGRLWFAVTTVALLLLSLAANTFMARFIRRMQPEEVNLRPAVNQIRESTAAISELPRPATVPAPPESPPRNPHPATPDLPTRQVSNRPPTGKLAIAKKPTMLKPSDAFQFRVKGNPAPEVVWSSEGPGSIDPVHGLYKAPSQFAGETKVKIIAKSWRGSRSVTFTLKGGPK